MTSPRLSLRMPAWLVPALLLLGVGAVTVSGRPLLLGVLIGILAAVSYGVQFAKPGEIATAAWRGILRMWRVCLALLFIGLALALWTEYGTIALLIHWSRLWIQPATLPWMGFLLASAVSLTVGSCLATWGILLPPLLALASPASIPLVAGTLVAGGMVGDRASPLSTSVQVMAAATGLPAQQVLRQVLRSAVVPWVATFCALWLVAKGSFFGIRTTAVHGILAHSMSVPRPAVGTSALEVALTVLPVALVLILALARVSLVVNLGVNIVVTVALLWVRGIHLSALALWIGAPLIRAGHSAHLGGLLPMASLCAIILAAGAFQGITLVSGAIETVTGQVFALLRQPLSWLLGAYGVSVAMACLMGSQSLAILMSGQALGPRFVERGVTSAQLLRLISDAAELVAAVVPWSLLGLQASAIAGVPMLRMAPFAWYIWLSITWSFVVQYRAQRLQNPVMQDSECERGLS